MRREVAWAKRKRKELTMKLGGACVKCGRKRRLHFDHIDSSTRTWNTRSKSRWMRMVLYFRDFERGFLQLLCESHNQSKGNR